LDFHKCAFSDFLFHHCLYQIYFDVAGACGGGFGVRLFSCGEFDAYGPLFVFVLGEVKYRFTIPQFVLDVEDGYTQELPSVKVL
jgi:hypothetical protein